jgi:hypothetical protein
MLKYSLVLTLLIIGKVFGWSLKIVHPTPLMESFKTYDKDSKDYVNGLIKSSLGNFGHFAYGSTIKGRVHYPLKNQDGCLPFHQDHFNNEHLISGRNMRHPPIIMVDRGLCHFVIKAQNVQKFGGVMAIIVDNKDGEVVNHIVMADDGKGESINIPTFLIGKLDGAKIKEVIHDHKADLENKNNLNRQ